jgi:hypothetical protein
MMNMDSHEDQTQFVKKVVLPSGKTIEVVLFGDAELTEPAPQHAPAEPDQDLHLCLECQSELVYPVQWEEAGPDSWHILLRCPECEWNDSGIFPQGQCDRFDDELESGTDALSRDYKRLVTANMSEEIDRFSAALRADAILPVDF